MAPHLGSRTAPGPGGYSIYLIPEGDELESVIGIQKAIGIKTFQIYEDHVRGKPGYTAKYGPYTKPAVYPPRGILILPDSLCGNSSAESVLRMATAVAEAYTGGHIRVTFKDTNVVGGSGGSVRTEIKEKEFDHEQLDTLRTALKNRLWGNFDNNKKIPTPYLPLLEVSLDDGKPEYDYPWADDGGLTKVMEESSNTAKRYDGVVPDLTLTKVLVVGNGEIGVAPIPAKK
ncbi:uncharacterized protein LOC62_03G005114 [Vanrija pseudolonga]|uniref:Uncharacterized protein n=1 Tax=Vanrija pseudolonga TaxID=143232 RepID=A0AAF0Y802_9TREE|nr:hypothetical protein LOC62_03G005114 [Vanrija pseudolonga]